MSHTRVIQGPGFRICFDDEPDFLRAYVFDGTDSLEVSLAVWRMLAGECEATGYSRLLVVEDLRSTVDLPGIEAVVDAMSETAISGVRVAFVELGQDIQGAEFAQILSVERGMTGRAFSNEAEARHWLIYGD